MPRGADAPIEGAPDLRSSVRNVRGMDKGRLARILYMACNEVQPRARLVQGFTVGERTGRASSQRVNLKMIGAAGECR